MLIYKETNTWRKTHEYYGVRYAPWQHHLRSLGITDRGEIAAGQIADIVLVDDSLTPRMTIIGGEVMRS